MNLAKAWLNKSIFNSALNRFTSVLFIIYLITLFWILLFKLGVQFSYMGTRQVNLIPFSEQIFSEVILNVVIFAPLGIYAGILFESWIFGKNLFFFFLMSLLVEGLQFILAVGAFDITDIITNTLGGIIGLMIFKAIEKAFNNNVKAQKSINIIAAIGTVVMILLLFLLKMDMLPVRYK